MEQILPQQPGGDVKKERPREPGNAADRRRAFYSPVGITSLNLERMGGDLILYVEIDGVDYEVLREYDPGNPLSHWVSAGGIRTAIEFGMDRGSGRRKPRGQQIRSRVGGRRRPPPRAVRMEVRE